MGKAERHRRDLLAKLTENIDEAHAAEEELDEPQQAGGPGGEPVPGAAGPTMPSPDEFPEFAPEDLELLGEDSCQRYRQAAGLTGRPGRC